MQQVEDPRLGDVSMLNAQTGIYYLDTANANRDLQLPTVKHPEYNGLLMCLFCGLTLERLPRKQYAFVNKTSNQRSGICSVHA